MYVFKNSKEVRRLPAGDRVMRMFIYMYKLYSGHNYLGGGETK